mgnify:CR=1 FL=1
MKETKFKTLLESTKKELLESRTSDTRKHLMNEDGPLVATVDAVMTWAEGKDWGDNIESLSNMTVNGVEAQDNESSGTDVLEKLKASADKEVEIDALSDGAIFVLNLNEFEIKTDKLVTEIETTSNLNESSSDWPNRVKISPSYKDDEKARLTVFDWTGKTDSTGPIRTYYEMSSDYHTSKIDNVINAVTAAIRNDDMLDYDSDVTEEFADDPKVQELRDLTSTINESEDNANYQEPSSERMSEIYKKFSDIVFDEEGFNAYIPGADFVKAQEDLWVEYSMTEEEKQELISMYYNNAKNKPFTRSFTDSEQEMVDDGWEETHGIGLFTNASKYPKLTIDTNAGQLFVQDIPESGAFNNSSDDWLFAVDTYSEFLEKVKEYEGYLLESKDEFSDMSDSQIDAKLAKLVKKHNIEVEEL